MVRKLAGRSPVLGESCATARRESRVGQRITMRIVSRLTVTMRPTRFGGVDPGSRVTGLTKTDIPGAEHMLTASEFVEERKRRSQRR